MDFCSRIIQAGRSVDAGGKAYTSNWQQKILLVELHELTANSNISNIDAEKTFLIFLFFNVFI